MTDNDFARLFSVDGHQVLFWVEVDPEDDDRYRLNQISVIDGVYINIAGGGIDKERAEILEKCTEEQARKFLKHALAMVQPDEEDNSQ